MFHLIKSVTKGGHNNLVSWSSKATIGDPYKPKTQRIGVFKKQMGLGKEAYGFIIQTCWTQAETNFTDYCK